MLPGERVPTLPCLAAQTVVVADLNSARKLVESNGIGAHGMSDGFFVSAADALGASIGFVPA